MCKGRKDHWNTFMDQRAQRKEDCGNPLHILALLMRAKPIIIV